MIPRLTLARGPRLLLPAHALVDFPPDGVIQHRQIRRPLGDLEDIDAGIVFGLLALVGLEPCRIVVFQHGPLALARPSLFQTAAGHSIPKQGYLADR